MSDFGTESYHAGFSFKGSTDPEVIEHMILSAIESAGMTPIFDKKVFTWTEEGVGYIHVQCLYESCALADVWPKHKGGFLYVISCKPFEPDAIAGTLNRLGYAVGLYQTGHLFL